MRKMLKILVASSLSGLVVLGGITPAFAADPVVANNNTCYVDLDLTQEEVDAISDGTDTRDLTQYLVCEVAPTPEGVNDNKLDIATTITDADRKYFENNKNGTIYSNLTDYSPQNVITEGGIIVGVDRPRFVYNTYNAGDITALPMNVDLSLTRSIGQVASEDSYRIIGVEVTTLNQFDWEAAEPNASDWNGLEQTNTSGTTTNLIENGKTIPSEVNLPVLDTATGNYNEGSVSFAVPSVTAITVDGSATRLSYDFVVTYFEKDMYGEIVKNSEYYSVTSGNIDNCEVAVGIPGTCVAGTSFSALQARPFYNEEEIRPYTANVFVDTNADGIRNNGEELYTGSEAVVNGSTVVNGVVTGSQAIRYNYSAQEDGSYLRNPLYSGYNAYFEATPADYTLTTSNSLELFGVNADGTFNSNYVAEFGITPTAVIPPVEPPVVVVPPVVVEPPVVTPPVEVPPVVVEPVTPPVIIKNGGADLPLLPIGLASGLLMLGGAIYLISRKKTANN